MKAVLKTKSNFKNVNGRELEVVELLGKTISCKVPEHGFWSDVPTARMNGKMITADFNVETELVALFASAY